MTAQQRIVRVRRSYNQWVANQTLEDYALRFTAKSARRWSSLRVANTAIGAVSFLALEAIGGSITVNYGFLNATAAILTVGVLIFLTCIPIAYYASTYGVDIDLLTRGAGFGYIGSTVTSLIYASFTFLFFAIEAAIMSLALELCFGVPLFIGYVFSSLIVIPLVTHGITFIGRLQLWTQPVWIGLHLLPFVFIAAIDPDSFQRWSGFSGLADAGGQSFNLVLFGTASTVVFSLIAQIGEQVDFLRFLPPREDGTRANWWAAYLAAGPGWIVPGVLKLLAGSFLTFLAIEHLVSLQKAAEPTQMYLVGFRYVFSSPQLALAFTGAFVIISQIKINVTNAYAGSIAWSNFFSRLTHSHPGRVVWLVFNVAIALMLMELGIFKMLEHILGLYSLVAVAWVGALVADLAINKPLGLSPAGIEFKRAHLYDINPVGVGAMFAASLAGIVAFSGALGVALQSLSAFVALAVAFVMAPAIAFATKGRFYLARRPRQDWSGQAAINCSICEHPFEAEDMAHCPAYSGPICSLCCSLETRCRDFCKPHARLPTQALALADRILPDHLIRPLKTDVGRYVGLLLLFASVIGSVLALVYFQVSLGPEGLRDVLKSTLWTVFFILTIIAGVAAWLFVLAQDSRRVAEEETRRQTDLLMNEIEAHKRTDAKLQKAKEAAEAASKAKSRHVVGLSHELRTPLNAILGYSQLLERDPALPPRRRDAIKVVRRSAEHLSGLIDGLLDISKIEAGRFHLNRNEVHTAEFLGQLADMFRLQASAKGIAFHYVPSERLPAAAHTDENRLRQILLNLLSNAVKFTDRGHVTFRVGYRHQVATFEIEDTGVGIHKEDIERIFHPFERARTALAKATIGTGLGLTITKLLINVMGGNITVTSAVGKGSAFRVKLLLSEVSRPRIVSTREDRVRGYIGPRQIILAVDDNEVQCGLVRDLLGPLGFDVLSATTGAEGLAIAAQRNPNLVLLDIAMPDMDGWQVARRLRESSRERAAIVMLSANPIDPSRLSDTERLHDDYLIKPVDLRQLLKTVHALLNIEWVYAPECDASPLPAEAAASSTPPDHEIEELIGLGQIGHIRGIQDKLAAIEIGSPEHAAFVAQMRTLIGAFDLKRYLAALEAVRSNHAQI
ncbi:MAG: response regulator [Hyphomicrobiales bacterium]|nr:response regulator [Hyphomicrobiales bacterium]MBV8823877.1 response regulator [Hyphomicrobiales bacterium]